MSVGDYRAKLSNAAERLDRFILSSEPMDDDECERYFASDQYQKDIGLLVKEARKVVVGLGWYGGGQQ